MKQELDKVKKFHDTFDRVWSDEPKEVDATLREFRIKLMEEEIKELITAMREEPIENIAKELGDVFHVLYGTVGVYGLADKMEEIFAEVNRSNLSKTPDESGKPTKGENYLSADIKSILSSHP